MKDENVEEATEELETAARWARTRLEQAHARLTAADPNAPLVYPRIGVVVPDLQQRRREVNRVFSRVMAPAWTVPGVEAGALPFNLSLGLPLNDYPLVHAALGVLALATGEIDFALASRLLRLGLAGGGWGGRLLLGRRRRRVRRSLLLLLVLRGGATCVEWGALGGRTATAPTRLPPHEARGQRCGLF